MWFCASKSKKKLGGGGSIPGSREVLNHFILILAYRVPFPCPCQETSENQVTPVPSLQAFQSLACIFTQLRNFQALYSFSFAEGWKQFPVWKKCIQGRERPPWGRSNESRTRREATRVKGGEVWGNKMSKEISHVVWLVTLVNIKTTQKLLCSLNVYKKLGQKRGKERFCSLSQNLKSYRIIF